MISCQQIEFVSLQREEAVIMTSRATRCARVKQRTPKFSVKEIGGDSWEGVFRDAPKP